MRYAWLLLLLALPASAQEFQVDITGIARGAAPEPFVMSFDMNASSGTQSYNFQYGCVISFSAVVPITNLSTTIGGEPFPLSASSMALDGSGLGTICGGSINVLEVGTFPTSLFYEEIDTKPPTTLGTYPVVSLMQYLGTGPGNASLSINGEVPPLFDLGDVRWSVTSVPEPGTLGLLTMGFVGLFASRVRRRGRAAR